MNNFQVAIDGPAGSGKSTISKLVAAKLNFNHIDTGAMYRAVTLEALNRKINIENEDEYNFLNDIVVTYDKDKILLNNQDVSNEIRTTIVTNNVSAVSRLKVVRDAMVNLQQKAALHGQVVMDGRDIGYVVLPYADVKVFLTASVEERARRRFLEEKNGSTYEQILEDIKTRDYKDSNREISPLKKAHDAILIDTTTISVDEVVEKIIQLVNERLGNMEDIREMKDVVLSKKVRVSDVVEGEVISVMGNKIYIDLHTFTEGVMFINEYTYDKKVNSFDGLVKVGDIVTGVVKKINEEEGAILMSALPLLRKQKEESVKKMYEEKQTVTVLVDKVVNKGVVGNASGVTVFIPENQIEFETADLNSYVGKKLEVRLIDFNERSKNYVGSAKVLLREAYAENKTKEYDAINVGEVLTGVVSKIEPFGVLVKFNYNQGLLRISQIAHTRINSVSDVLSVGDKVEVKVIKKEAGRLDLSRKALLQTPHQIYANEHKASDVVTGEVLQKLPFGVIVKLAENITGLIHKNEFSWNPNDNSIASVKIGDKIEVAILSIDSAKEKISLSKKVLIDNPWSRVNAKEGQLTEVKVAEIIPGKGLKVEAFGVDGFIAASELSFGEKSTKIEDNYQVNDMIAAVVTEVNPRTWDLKLSVKKHVDAVERSQFESYMETQTEADEKVTLGDLFKDILN